MTQPDETAAKRKTLAIRLDDDLHQRVSTIAKLTGVSVTDLIRDAIERHVSTIADSPALAAQAEALLADIEREADQRKQALKNLLATPGTPSARKPRTTPPAKG